MVEQGTEGLLHVGGRGSNRLHVSVELVVDPGVPVGEENHDVGVGLQHALTLQGKHFPTDVGLPTWLKADVAANHLVSAVRLFLGERLNEVLNAHDFLNTTHH